MNPENEKNETEKQWLWTDEYNVCSYEVDANGKAPLTSICRFMQETAYLHANHLEFGFDQLKTKNCFWVLFRLLIKMERYPAWREKVKIQTWPSGIDGLYAFRDFRFLDSENKIIGCAATTWLILDSEKHRPQRPDGLKELTSYFHNERSMNERPAKLSKPTTSESKPFSPVKYSDTDLYRHVNNAKYIQWILDDYPLDILNNYDVSEFEINFVSEAKMGDEVAIETEKIDHPSSSPEFLHCIHRKGDSREVCLARAVWRPYFLVRK